MVTQYAMRLRRLEDEEPHQTTPTTPTSRARVVVTRLKSGANRSSLASCTELALYVYAEQAHWQTHTDGVGQQRDTCEVLGAMMDSKNYLHSVCDRRLLGAYVTLLLGVRVG